MKLYKMGVSGFVMAVGITLVGCSSTSKSPDVSDSIRKSLDQPNLKDVSVSQDRDKGIVTLRGHVAADADKTQAESIARSIAGDKWFPMRLRFCRREWSEKQRTSIPTWTRRSIRTWTPLSFKTGGRTESSIA